MRLILRSLPVELANAATGAEAIDLILKQLPDLILLDINLPDMHGWDVLNKIKDVPQFDPGRVIVMTSHAEPVHRLIGMLQPISAYVRKPVEAEELRRMVRAALKLE
jgi:CheY-like chemotaxis protein